MKSKISLNQMRGPWIAKVVGSRSNEIVGAAYVAVMRDFSDGQFDFPKLSFRSRRSTVAGDQSDWWMKSEQEKWRELLFNGAVIWIREAIDDGTPTGTVGRSKGVWRIDEVSLDAEGLSFSLIERLGDT